MVDNPDHPWASAPPSPWHGEFTSTAQTIADHLKEHIDFEDFEVSTRDSDGTTVVQFTDTETGCSCRVTIEEVKEEEPALADAEREQLTQARDKLVLLGVNAGDAWQAVNEAREERTRRDAEVVTLGVYRDRGRITIAMVHALSDGTIEVRRPATVPGTLGEKL